MKKFRLNTALENDMSADSRTESAVEHGIPAGDQHENDDQMTVSPTPSPKGAAKASTAKGAKRDGGGDEGASSEDDMSDKRPPSKKTGTTKKAPSTGDKPEDDSKDEKTAETAPQKKGASKAKPDDASEERPKKAAPKKSDKASAEEKTDANAKKSKPAKKAKESGTVDDSKDEKKESKKVSKSTKDDSKDDESKKKKAPSKKTDKVGKSKDTSESKESTEKKPSKKKKPSGDRKDGAEAGKGKSTGKKGASKKSPDNGKTSGDGKSAERKKPQRDKTAEVKPPEKRSSSAAAAEKSGPPEPPGINRAAVAQLPTIRNVYDKAMELVAKGETSAQLRLSLDIPAVCHFFNLTHKIFRFEPMKPQDLEKALCAERPFEASPHLAKILTRLLIASKKLRNKLLPDESFDPADLDVLVELFVTRLYERAQTEGKQRDKIVQDEEDDGEEEEDNENDEEAEEGDDNDGLGRKRSRTARDDSGSSKKVKSDKPDGESEEEVEEADEATSASEPGTKLKFKSKMPPPSLGLDLSNSLAVIASVDNDLAYAALQLAHAGDNGVNERGIPLSVLQSNRLAAELVEVCTKNENLADSMRFDLRMLFDTWEGANPFAEGEARCKAELDIKRNEYRSRRIAEFEAARAYRARTRFGKNTGDDSIEDELTDHAVDKAIGITAFDKYPGFSSLDPVNRLRILYLICEYRAHAADLHSELRGKDVNTLRIEPFGPDSRGYLYYYFAQDERRIYIQRQPVFVKPPPLSYANVEEEQVPECSPLTSSSSADALTASSASSSSSSSSSTPSSSDLPSVKAPESDGEAEQNDSNGDAMTAADEDLSSSPDAAKANAPAKRNAPKAEIFKPSWLYKSYYDYSSFLTSDDAKGNYKPSFIPRGSDGNKGGTSSSSNQALLPESGLACQNEDELKDLITKLKNTDSPVDEKIAIALFNILDEHYKGKLHYGTLRVMTDAEYNKYIQDKIARANRFKGIKSDTNKQDGAQAQSSSEGQALPPDSAPQESSHPADPKTQEPEAKPEAKVEPKVEDLPFEQYRRTSTRLQAVFFEQREQDRLQAMIEEDTRRERLYQREREIRKWAQELMRVLGELAFE